MNAPEDRSSVQPEAASKGARTRTHILDTALLLFREHGFEATSMRAIAQAAGVSVGNAYHYFESKEHLVQAFYERVHAEHLAACESKLAGEKDLAQRLRIALVTRIETAEPYHHLSALLFRTAADPKSPLNPFSSQSRAVRGQATALMERVVSGSRTRVPADLRAELPELLWLYEMSVILFWIHDESHGRTRTRRLIEHTCTMVARLVALAGNPFLRPMRRDVIGLLADLRADPDPATARGRKRSRG